MSTLPPNDNFAIVWSYKYADVVQLIGNLKHINAATIGIYEKKDLKNNLFLGEGVWGVE